jgi:hypothetical protein
VFLVGQYTHSWLQGPEAFQEFINDNAVEIHTKNMKKLLDPFERADLMIEVLRKCPIVTDMKQCQHETIMVGEIAGVKIKIMVDLLDLERGYFADLKTTQKINSLGWKNGKKVSFIEMFSYKVQFAIYEEIIFQNTGKHLDGYIIAVDKQPRPRHNIIYMGNTSNTDWYAEKIEEIELKLPHLYLVKSGKEEPKRCNECDYCISTEVLTGPISLQDFEERLRD